MGTADTTLTAAEQRQAEKREQIIDAALAVFARDGFAAARTDTIAEEAGVAKGTLYLYFKSKEEMFEAAVRARMLPVIDGAAALPKPASGSAADLMRAQMEFFYSQVVASERRQIIRLILSEGSRFPELAAFYHREVIRRGEAVFQQTIDLGVARGEFRPFSTERIHMLIGSPALMAALWKIVFEAVEPLDLDSFFEAHVDFVLRALAAE